MEESVRARCRAGCKRPHDPATRLAGGQQPTRPSTPGIKPGPCKDCPASGSAFKGSLNCLPVIRAKFKPTHQVRTSSGGLTSPYRQIHQALKPGGAPAAKELLLGSAPVKGLGIYPAWPIFGLSWKNILNTLRRCPGQDNSAGSSGTPQPRPQPVAET